MDESIVAINQCAPRDTAGENTDRRRCPAAKDPGKSGVMYTKETAEIYRREGGELHCTIVDAMYTGKSGVI